MRELRFHRRVFQAEAVDEAMTVFARFAELERTDDDEHVVVTIRAKNPDQEDRIAGELNNYALGLTIDRQGSD